MTLTLAPSGQSSSEVFDGHIGSVSFGAVAALCCCTVVIGTGSSMARQGSSNS